MKRFTETAKWSDPWFRRLSPGAKLLWLWICDNCDHAGVIDMDLELASFQTGYGLGNDTLSELGNRLGVLPCEKYYLPGFIRFQQGKLSRECKAHNPIFSSIEKHDLIGFDKLIESLWHTPQVIVKVKVKSNTVPAKGFIPPSLDEVKLCAAKAGLSDQEAEKFFNYYTANGWKVGRNAMKSWTHALANWRNNVQTYGNRNQKPNPRNSGVVGEAAQRSFDIAAHVAGQQAGDASA